MIRIVFLSIFSLGMFANVMGATCDGDCADHADEVALLQVQAQVPVFFHQELMKKLPPTKASDEDERDRRIAELERQLAAAKAEAAAQSPAAAKPQVAAPVQVVGNESQKMPTPDVKTLARAHTHGACPSGQTCQRAGDWSSKSASVAAMGAKYCDMHNKMYTSPSQLTTWMDVDKVLYDKAKFNAPGYIDPVALVVFLLLKTGAMSQCENVGHVIGDNGVGLSTLPTLFGQSMTTFAAAYPELEESDAAIKALGCACA